MKKTKPIEVQDTVLVFSENEEYSTDRVFEWLEYYGQKHLRVNQEDKIELKEYRQTDDRTYFEITINKDISLQSSQIKSFWYRRGAIRLQSHVKENYNSAALPQEVKEKIYKHLCHENKRLNETLYFYLENLEYAIGKSSNSVNNKLNHFAEAKKLGLKTPETVIFSQKSDLANFFKETNQKEVVVKSISDVLVLNISNDRESYMSYTEEFNIDDLSAVTESFFPSLFQEKLDKKYELRIFYLHNKFYPMAIFSQNDPQTQVDFRKYNYIKPNRNLPFMLPVCVETRLQKLMDVLSLNTGSIDMIVTKDNEYYFLEVNPVGQFGMVSVPCNYYLEREIAKILSRNKNTEAYNTI